MSHIYRILHKYKVMEYNLLVAILVGLNLLYKNVKMVD